MIGALTAWLQLVRDLSDKFRPPGSDQSDGGPLATPTPLDLQRHRSPPRRHQVADHSEPGAKAVPEDMRSEQRGVIEPAVRAVPVIAAARSWARSGRMAARRFNALGETVRSGALASAHGALSDRFPAATKLYLITLAFETTSRSNRERRGATLAHRHLRRSDARPLLPTCWPAPDPRRATGCASSDVGWHMRCFLADRRARTTDQHDRDPICSSCVEP